MKKYSRVCAYIDLDAIAYNMGQMKKRIGEDGKLIAKRHEIFRIC